MRKILFLDRDGTIICEDPIHERIDHIDKFRLMPGVIPALQALHHAGYIFVMVTNQDGLGTPEYPERIFYSMQDFLLDRLSTEGITFYHIHIDTHSPADQHPDRKPGTGMLGEYMNGEWDLENSFVIGDRLTDVLLAYNLGSKGILLNHAGLGDREIQEEDREKIDAALAAECKDWKEVTRFLLEKS